MGGTIGEGRELGTVELGERLQSTNMLRLSSRTVSHSIPPESSPAPFLLVPSFFDLLPMSIVPFGGCRERGTDGRTDERTKGDGDTHSVRPSACRRLSGID